jgi:hypothetical protein
MRDEIETEVQIGRIAAMGDLRADRQKPTVAPRRPVRRIVCRLLGHVRVPAVDEWDLVYVRCRSCRRDLTLDA